jgi:hypothetical protein
MKSETKYMLGECASVTLSMLIGMSAVCVTIYIKNEEATGSSLSVKAGLVSIVFGLISVFGFCFYKKQQIASYVGEEPTSNGQVLTMMP